MNQLHHTCLLCNSTAIFELKNYEKDFLVKCKECDFVFCKRIPTADELINHYKKYTRNGSISPITIKRYHELINQFEKYRKTNNILDIGCGDGFFLEVAKERGWNVFGTEFTDEAIETCINKGINVQKGILNPKNYNTIRFDVITSFEVIEHINNPQSELKNIYALLREQGVLYFTTPNFNSFSRYSLKHKWNIIEYPEHLSYYTAKTIHLFFKKNGFKKIELLTTGININRYKSSINNNQTDFLTKNVEEELRIKSEKVGIYNLAKKSINFILNILKMGDSIKGIYIKN